MSGGCGFCSFASASNGLMVEFFNVPLAALRKPPYSDRLCISFNIFPVLQPNIIRLFSKASHKFFISKLTRYYKLHVILFRCLGVDI